MVYSRGESLTHHDIVMGFLNLLFGDQSRRGGGDSVSELNAANRRLDNAKEEMKALKRALERAKQSPNQLFEREVITASKPDEIREAVANLREDATTLEQVRVDEFLRTKQILEESLTIARDTKNERTRNRKLDLAKSKFEKLMAFSESDECPLEIGSEVVDAVQKMIDDISNENKPEAVKNDQDVVTPAEVTPYEPDATPYGLNKPASECSVEDLKASQELVWKDHEEALEGLQWKLVVGLDYKTTPMELALHGVKANSRDELPMIPKETGSRIQEVVFDPEDTFWDSEDLNIKMAAKTAEELIKIKGASLYKTKTSKKATGECYFIASIPLKAKPENEAGAFLKRLNKLTRRMVLGEELTVAFEAAMKRKEDPQEWINKKLGHLRQPRSVD